MSFLLRGDSVTHSTTMLPRLTILISKIAMGFLKTIADQSLCLTSGVIDSPFHTLLCTFMSLV
uniref:Uncharacterized protein n=1 Tax=Anguilla anguilla TaxID=7936 RepID=A0A0E9PU15_ANGAN